MVVDQLFARETIDRWIEFGTPAGKPEIVEDDLTVAVAASA